jgi:hypothetical protein
LKKTERLNRQDAKGAEIGRVTDAAFSGQLSAFSFETGARSILRFKLIADR